MSREGHPTEDRLETVLPSVDSQTNRTEGTNQTVGSRQPTMTTCPVMTPVIRPPIPPDSQGVHLGREKERTLQSKRPFGRNPQVSTPLLTNTDRSRDLLPVLSVVSLGLPVVSLLVVL